MTINCERCARKERCWAAKNRLESKLFADGSVCQQFIPLTNADRIRRMSDEALARFIAELHAEAYSGAVCFTPEEALAWLESEVKS